MKAIMILVMVIGLTLSVYAGCENSTLVIRTQTGVPVKVYLDGMTGRNRPTEAVTVTDIVPGQHELKVVSVYVDEYGQTRRHTIYKGFINVPGYMHMEGRVEEGRGIAIHQTRVECGENYEGNAPTNGDRGYDQQSNDQNGYAQSNNPQAPHDNNYNYGSAPSSAPAQPSYSAPATASSGNLPAHISDDDFEQLKNTIAATKYETKKMDTLKVLVAGNYFATSQVSVLMNLFAFESNKFDVAKMLYDHTVDKQNYGRLAANFNFDARKEDFKKFMAGK